MTSKHKERGLPTYRRFFIHSIFNSQREYAKLWEKIILEKLDEPARWTLFQNKIKTDFGSNHVELKSTRRFGKRIVGFEIGLYRDGFHLSLTREEYNISIKERSNLLKRLFGDINLTSGWTQEAEKVAPMMNSIVKEVSEFFKDKL